MKFSDSLYLPAYYMQVEYLISVDYPNLVAKVLSFKEESDMNTWLQREKKYSYVRVHPDYQIFLIEAGTLADEVKLTKLETNILLSDMAAWYYNFKVMYEPKKYNRFKVGHISHKRLLKNY